MAALGTGVGTRPRTSATKRDPSAPSELTVTRNSTWLRRAMPYLALAAGAVALSFVARHFIYPGYSWNRDEITYLWQTNALRAREITTTDGGAAQFFWPWLAGLRDGMFFSQYTIGWPIVLLGVQVVFGSPDFALSIGTVMAVLGTYVFTRELTRDKTLALVAGVLMLASPIVVLQSGIFLSYLFALGLGLFFCAAVLAGLRRNSRWLLVVAGGLLGGVLLTRPFDIVLWAMPVAAYAVFVYWRRWKLLFRAAFWVVVGVLPFIVITLLYNRRVTGSFTEFPLTAKNPLDTLGFGARSLMPGDSTLDYTIGRAFRSAAKNIRVLPPFLFGGFLAMAVAAVGLWVRRRDRTTLLLLAIMAVFPLAYFFFWGTLLSSPFAALTGPLYYIPLFAPLCVLVAAAILALWRSRRGWAVALCFALAVATVPVMIAKIDRNHTISVAQLPWKNATATIREDSLVFVEGGGMYPIHLNPYAQNAPNLDGRILFAADREAENIDLISANPTRAPYLERTSDPAWDNPGHKAPPPEISLVPLTVVDGRTVTLRVRVTNPDRDAVVVVYLNAGTEIGAQTRVDVRTFTTGASSGTFETEWTLTPSTQPAATADGAVALTPRLGDVSVGFASGQTVEQALAGRQTQEHFSYRLANDHIDMLYPSRKFFGKLVQGKLRLREVDALRTLDVELVANK